MEDIERKYLVLFAKIIFERRVFVFIPDDKGCKYVFIDESGNFGIDFSNEGTSTHFIISAIIVEEEYLDTLRSSVDIIKEKYFPKGEIKSSKISKKHRKRLQILREITDLEFNIITLVIDKRKIYYENTGLEFKPVFMKYLNSLLYKELKLIYPYLKVYADCHGSEKFMNQFSNYVIGVGSISLFDSFQFEFVNSKEEPIIQLADLICGTISYGYEERKKCVEYMDFNKLLGSKILLIRHWPASYENYLKNLEVVQPSVYDKRIAEYCLRATTKYIKEKEKSEDINEINRIKVLYYMLNQIYAYNPNRYIYSNEIIELLNKTSEEKYDNHSFMTTIIAHLRDNGVIIASSSNGYKIPISEKELYSYTNKTLSQVIPMLDRLKKARDRVLAVTNNKIDILGQPENKKILKLWE